MQAASTSPARGAAGSSFIRQRKAITNSPHAVSLRIPLGPQRKEPRSAVIGEHRARKTKRHCPVYPASHEGHSRGSVMTRGTHPFPAAYSALHHSESVALRNGSHQGPGRHPCYPRLPRPESCLASRAPAVPRPPASQRRQGWPAIRHVVGDETAAFQIHTSDVESPIGNRISCARAGPPGSLPKSTRNRSLSLSPPFSGSACSCSISDPCLPMVG